MTDYQDTEDFQGPLQERFNIEKDSSEKGYRIKLKRTVEEVLDIETGTVFKASDFFRLPESVINGYSRILQEAIEGVGNPRFVCPYCMQLLEIFEISTSRGEVKYFSHLLISKKCVKNGNTNHSSERKSGVKNSNVKESGKQKDIKVRMAQSLNSEESQFGNNKFAYVKRNQKYGFLNSRGEVHIPCIFDHAYNILNGYSVVCKDNSWYNLDVKNKKISGLDFLKISSFKENDMFLKTFKYGYNHIGEYGVMTLDGYFLGGFCGNFAVISNQNGEKGCIHKSGTWILQFDKEHKDVYIVDNQNLRVIKGDKFMLVNFHLKEFRYTLCDQIITANGTFYIDNEKQIYDKYNRVRAISKTDQFSGITIAILAGSYGIISDSYEIVVPFIYNKIGKLSNEAIYAEQNNKWVILNSKGEVISAHSFDEFNLCRNGIKVRHEAKYGFLDVEGNVLLPCIYSYLSDFEQDSAVASHDNRTFGIVNSKGEVICDFIHEAICSVATGYFVCKYGEWSLIGYDGQYIIDAGFKGVKIINQKYACVKLKKWGIISSAGELVVDCIYDNISVTKSNIKFKMGSSRCVIPISGEITDPELST